LLLLVQGWPYITPFLHNFEVPPMEWGRMRYTIPYSACLWAGLSCTSFGDGGSFATIRKIIVLVVAAYAFSALAGAAFLAWIDFAAREVNGPGSLQHFFAAFPAINDPSDIGLWVIWLLLTPGALIAGIVLTAASHPWNSHPLVRLESLPFVLLVATAGCAAFLFGSGNAERLSSAVPGLVDAADLAWPVLPIVALGSLAAWVTLEWRGASAPSRPPSGSREPANIENILSSASRTSLLVVVLLYLGISQTSVYANRTAELVDARKAFASDILYAFFSKGGTLNGRSSINGKLLENSSLGISGVPWADVRIVQYPGYQQYVVEVTRKPSEEKWSVRQYNHGDGTATRQIADEYGVSYESTDDATKIYPRIETQLRAADVSFPGAGISLDLTSFAFVIPVVVFATLVLFGHWLSELTRSSILRGHFAYYGLPSNMRSRVSFDHKGTELQWVLVDQRNGMVGMVTRLWLIAIAVGPWLLGVVFVEAMALTLRTKGMLNTPALEGAFSIYVGIIVVVLTVSTKTAVQNLIELRKLARATPRGAQPPRHKRLRWLISLRRMPCGVNWQGCRRLAPPPRESLWGAVRHPTVAHRTRSIVSSFEGRQSTLCPARLPSIRRANVFLCQTASAEIAPQR
jgi:hypothetical protein